MSETTKTAHQVYLESPENTCAGCKKGYRRIPQDRDKYFHTDEPNWTFCTALTESELLEQKVRELAQVKDRNEYLEDALRGGIAEWRKTEAQRDRLARELDPARAEIERLKIGRKSYAPLQDAEIDEDCR